MEDFRKTLQQFETNAKAEAQKLGAMFSEYRPDKRRELQAAERQKLTAKYSGQVRMFQGRIDARAKDVQGEIYTKKYPLLSSKSESERLRGAVEFNTGKLAEFKKYPLEEIRDAFSMGRFEYAHTLTERALAVQPKDERETTLFSQFKKMYDGIRESSGLKALEEEQRNLEKTRGLAERFKKQVELDFSVSPTSFEEYERVMTLIGA